MLKRSVLAVMVLSFAMSMYAAKVTEGFEDKAVLKKWEIEGDVAISKDQKHGGKSSLFVPPGSSAVLRFSPEDKYGTVSMWIYDSFNNKEATNWNGPYFGLINSDDDKAVEFIAFRAYTSLFHYNCIFTAENQWFSVCYSGIKRVAAAWAKFTFTFTDDKTLGANCNDESEDKVFPTRVEFFSKGANGVCFGGGTDIGEKNETFYIDDLEIDVKDAPKK